MQARSGKATARRRVQSKGRCYQSREGREIITGEGARIRSRIREENVEVHGSKRE